MSGSAEPGARVALASVSKSFGSTLALDSVSIVVEPGEFFSLLGPSGCGKTTLLRIVGGFEAPDSGSIEMSGRDVSALSPQARPTAMVFQNYALFPHMTVGENVAYGLKVKRVRKAEISKRVKSALDGVGMGMLVDRPIAALSGGQQQRVALARAMAVTPRVLLFDEPLSNLDLALRDRTRAEIRRIQKETGITSLYVTHDQIEAMAMSDRIAVMRDGRVEQMGTPQDLFEKPETAFVASFLGSANIVRDPAATGTLTGAATIEAGKVLAVRPQAFVLDSPATPLDRAKSVEVDVIASQYLGAYREVTANLADGSEIRMNVDPHLAIADVMRVGIESWIWVNDD